MGDSRSFYIHREHKLEDADFRHLLGIREDPLRLLVPIAVVDELGGLKRSGSTCRAGGPATRSLFWTGLFATSTSAAVLSPADFTALGTGGIPASGSRL